MSNEAKLIQNIVESVVGEMNKSKMINKRPMTAYQKTEKLLKNYNAFKQVVNDRKEQIEEVKQYGVSKRSGSIIPMPSGSHENLTEAEKVQDAIETYQSQIAFTENCIKTIDDAMKKIESEPYAECIKMIYFDGKTIMDVADYFDRDEKTIRRNRSSLVNKLSVYLFSDDVIKELYA